MWGQPVTPPAAPSLAGLTGDTNGSRLDLYRRYPAGRDVPRCQHPCVHEVS